MIISTNKNFLFDIQLFAETATPLNPAVGQAGAGPVNVSTASGLSGEMKSFYNTQLLQNVRANLVFNQFGKKTVLPKGNGKNVEWRRMKTFAPITKSLVEGQIPQGSNLEIEVLTAPTAQYGDYTAISDVLEFGSVDPIIGEANNEHAANAALSLDSLTRNIVCGGTNLYFAGGVSDATKLTASSLMTYEDVAKMANLLERNNTPTIDGSYIAIVHPDVATDLMLNERFIDVTKYSAATKIFNNEIGKLHNVRFVKSTNAKIEKPATVAIYNCIFFGLDAWGVIYPEGMGLETIIKGKGEIGGPLEQFSTVGWKAMHGAKILYEERMINYQCSSSLSAIATEN